MKEELVQKVAEINKKFGSQKIINADDDYFSIKRVPTNIPTLDEKLDGGLPLGRYVVLWGKEGCGKSTVSLMTVAEAQKMGLQCMWINSEGTFNKEWAENWGVNTEEMIILKHEQNIENIIDAAVPLIKERLVDVVVIDSISPLRYTKYYEDDNNAIGSHARSMQEMLNKLAYYNHETLIILISQIRAQSKGQFFVLGYQGGHIVEHAASITIKFDDKKENRIAESKDDDPYAKWVDWNVGKNNTGIPYTTGRFIFDMSHGSINYMEQIISIGVRTGAVRKSGNWFIVKDAGGQDVKLNGRTGFEDYLADNAAAYKELKDEVLRGIYPG